MYGTVNVRTVHTTSARQMAREDALEQMDREFAQAQQIRQRQSDRWAHLSANSSPHWNQLPTTCAVSDTDRQTIAQIEKTWIGFMTGALAALTSTGHAPVISFLQVDAQLDFYRLLNDHIKIIDIFLGEYRRLRTSNPEDEGQFAPCFRLFTRLPFEDNREVMRYMGVLNDNNLSTHLTDNPSEWTGFVRCMRKDFATYSKLRKSYLDGEGGHPVGGAHQLEFESHDSFQHQASTRPMYEMPATPMTDFLMGPYHVSRERLEYPLNMPPPKKPISWDKTSLHPEKAYAYHEIMARMTSEVNELACSPAARIHHELIASVLEPSPNTVMVGSSHPERIYRIMRGMDIHFLPAYFEEVPVLQQFTSLVRWVLWQLLDWENVWYADFVLTPEVHRAVVDSLGDQFKPHDHFFADVETPAQQIQAVSDYLAYTRQTSNTYFRELFGFPTDSNNRTCSFEDVIALTGLEAMMTSIRNTVFATFPPAVIAQRYDILGEDGRADNQRLFMDASKLFDTAMREASPETFEHVNHSIYYLVYSVFRWMTVSQIFEHARHLEMPMDLVNDLIEWQFRSTPKVDVLAYVIKRFRPNRPTLVGLRLGRSRAHPMMFDISGDLIKDVLWIPDHITDSVKTFMNYAEHLKKHDSIRSVLMASKFLTSLEQGMFKAMPEVIPEEEAARKARLLLAQPGRDTATLYPNDLLYTTPERRRRIPKEIINSIMLPMMGLPVERTTAQGTGKIVTPSEYLINTPELRKSIQTRHEMSFLTQPYDSRLRKVEFSPVQQVHTSEPTVRPADPSEEEEEKAPGSTPAASAPSSSSSSSHSYSLRSSASKRRKN